MHEQRGLFQGIDTCDITTVRNFSVPSILLEESESRTIINRSDINTSVRKLHREKFLTAESVSVRRENGNKIFPYPSFFD